MKLQRLKLTRPELERMPDNERTFLLLAGHLQNELVALNKIFGWCISPAESDTRIEAIVNGSQGFMIAKLLAGKLNEGWQLVQKAYFGSKLSLELAPFLAESTCQELTDLKVYFSKSNLIYSVRNTFSFHYSADEIAKHWQEAALEPDFDFYIGNEYGNTFHQASEMAVSFAVLKSINSESLAAALETFLTEVQDVTSLFNGFLSGVMIVLLERCLGPKLSSLGVEDEVRPNKRLEEIGIPFFYVPPSEHTAA